MDSSTAAPLERKMQLGTSMERSLPGYLNIMGSGAVTGFSSGPEACPVSSSRQPPQARGVRRFPKEAGPAGRAGSALNPSLVASGALSADRRAPATSAPRSPTCAPPPKNPAENPAPSPVAGQVLVADHQCIGVGVQLQHLARQVNGDDAS